MAERDDDWFVCPECGEVLVGDPTACPRCGSDEETGWSGSDDDLLPEEFDYDEFVRDELGAGPRRRRPAWILAGVLAALVAMAILAFCW